MRIDFHRSERATLGVEMEFALVDRATGVLASVGSDILREIGAGHPGGEHPKAKHELFECTIEVITGITSTPAEAHADISTTLREIADAAARRGLALICVGTHPFSQWRDQIVSPKARYIELVEQMQWTAQRLQIFGVHYHVGVRSGEKAVAIANALTTYLPHLLALSASSPYWQGHDTGLASCRTKVFEGLPTAGLPHRLAGWEDFEAFMETLVNAQAIKSIREVWWDIRPHPDFGTVEFRMCDGIPTIREAMALAAVAQSLVHTFDARLDAGAPLPTVREWVVRENKWLATRHGIDGSLIVDDRGSSRPTIELVRELVAELEPAAESLGCLDELHDVERILGTGPSYARQRRVVDRGGSPEDIVHHLVRELEHDEAEPA
ncbi:MAG: glutamate--cysteine ligase [Acidimicrobiia bacterium]